MSQIVNAADGQLDSTFGSGGKVITPSSNIGIGATAILTQSDGKIISVGYERVPVPITVGLGVTSHFQLARYNQNGTLDSTFGSGGKVLTPFFPDSTDIAYAAALQTDGKIIVVGRTSFLHANNREDRDFGVARYNTNGSLDSTFGDHGLVITDFNGGPDEAYALALQPNGKIVVGGTAAPGPNPDPKAGFYLLKFALARYNSDGSLDPSFGTGGKVVPSIQGEITGVATSLAIHGVAIQSDGKIVTGGDAPWTLARFDVAGNLDQSFGNGGTVTSFIENGGRGAMAIALQTDGKIIAGGYQATFWVVARYRTDGSLDPTFGTGGRVTTTFNGGSDLAFAMSLQNDGKIILAGWARTLIRQYDVGVARYNTNGALDSTFGNAGKITTDFAGNDDYVYGVAIQRDGKIIVAGEEQDSVALARYTGTPFNSIDETGFFVTEQYVDFLSRRPDQSGLDFWIGNITSCGTNVQCIEVNRINVSASFFLSIEFQETGYLVERIYKAAYGDGVGNSTFAGSHNLAVPITRLTDFLPDTQKIGQGVVVLQPGWEQQLENNKNAFTAEFVQRPRFTAAFLGMSAAQFVDKLNVNAGNPLSATERNQLVNDLTSGAKSRAQVLRAIAENQSLSNAEFNKAFVLMQYFGFLRRDPNSGQDSDYTGYDFWLTKLNQFNGNYVNAEMVKAFLSSIEYRQRFGP